MARLWHIAGVNIATFGAGAVLIVVIACGGYSLDGGDSTLFAGADSLAILATGCLHQHVPVGKIVESLVRLWKILLIIRTEGTLAVSFAVIHTVGDNNIYPLAKFVSALAVGGGVGARGEKKNAGQAQQNRNKFFHINSVGKFFRLGEIVVALPS